MNLNQAVKSYQIYLKALPLSIDQQHRYRSVLRHVLDYYGPNTSLETFDENEVLRYVKQYDPFDTDPVYEERGNVFCIFVQWLMQNNLIPAWNQAWAEDQEWDKEIEEGLQTRDNLHYS